MEKPTVIITEPIHMAGVERLKESGLDVVQMPPGSNELDLLKLAPRAKALVTRGNIKVTRTIMEASPSLKVVGVHGIGCDHVDLQAARDLGKKVINTPSALTETVAEMTLALMLALSRRIVSADKAVRSGGWHRKYGDLIGTEMKGKTVGIVGLGKIGEAVARRIKPFEADTVYFDVSDRGRLESELGIRKVDLDTLLRISDIVTLHVPYSPQTHHMFSRGEFERMKDGSCMINTSRGRILEQGALAEALKSGKLSGAALDVFEKEPLDVDDPLTSMDNVILTPHLGASSREAMRRMAIQVADGIVQILSGGSYENIVVE